MQNSESGEFGGLPRPQVGSEGVAPSGGQGASPPLAESYF